MTLTLPAPVPTATKRVVAHPARRPVLPRRPLASAQVPAVFDVVEEWGVQSFPASDPPANW